MAGCSGQRSALGVEVDSERQSGVGVHSAAVAVKRRRKVRLCLGTEKTRAGWSRCTGGGGCMRGAWRPGGRWRASERQLARSARCAGGRRFSTLLRRRQAHAVGRGWVGWASPSRCGFGPVTKQRLGCIEQWAGSGSAQYFSNYLKTAPIL
jgi:hypothetical protein